MIYHQQKRSKDKSSIAENKRDDEQQQQQQQQSSSSSLAMTKPLLPPPLSLSSVSSMNNDLPLPLPSNYSVPLLPPSLPSVPPPPPAGFSQFNLMILNCYKIINVCLFVLFLLLHRRFSNTLRLSECFKWTFRSCSSIFKYSIWWSWFTFSRCISIDNIRNQSIIIINGKKIIGFKWIIDSRCCSCS